MANNKMTANEIMDSKSDGGILNSDIMRALEDIDYDLTQVDLDSANPDELEGDALKEVERDAEAADESDFDTLTHREYIYSVLSSDLSYREKLSKIAEQYNVDHSFDYEYWRDIFSELEYLEKENADNLTVGKIEKRIENHKYLTRFLAYLVFRHVSVADSFDNLRARVGFCLLLTSVLESMIAERDLTFAEICDCARMISEEIEYSEDNTAALIFEMECIL